MFKKYNATRHFDYNYKPFRVIGYICDVPARALGKQIKGHTGYFSCEKCVVET